MSTKFRTRHPSITFSDFHFKANSTDLCDSVSYLQTKISADSLLSVFKQTLDNNPQILKLGIYGYADILEKSPQKLSEDRANIIMQKLIQRGIAAARLQTKGFGSSQLLVRENIIKSETDKNKQESLRQLNRRVSLQVNQ